MTPAIAPAQEFGLDLLETLRTSIGIAPPAPVLPHDDWSLLCSTKTDDLPSNGGAGFPRGTRPCYSPTAPTPVGGGRPTATPKANAVRRRPRCPFTDVGDAGGIHDTEDRDRSAEP